MTRRYDRLSSRSDCIIVVQGVCEPRTWWDKVHSLDITVVERALIPLWEGLHFANGFSSSLPGREEKKKANPTRHSLQKIVSTDLLSTSAS